jgi:Neuraminidase-like domain/FHA domain/Salmonella virulence plasmid 28.1kDa A protein
MTSNAPEDDGPRLVVTEPAELAGRVLPLAGPQQVIGHSDTATLMLEDQYVSRRHALVTIDVAGRVTITDLNSTGGTYVNGVQLSGPRVLADGDEVRFADLVTRFEPGRPVGGGAVAGGPMAEPGGSAAAPTQILPVLGASEAGTAGASPGGPAAADPEPADPGSVGPAVSYTVSGTVRSPALPGVGGLTVHLVDKNVGGDQVLASTQTSSSGQYSFTHPISAAYLARRRKTAPDLQVQVSAGGTVVASSQARYSAPTTITLDVVLPAGAAGLPSEYETLTANLAAVYAGSLSELQENAARQDITYLANKTGWDARAVALAALADQFSQLTAPAQTVNTANADPQQTLSWPVQSASIRPEFYYALFRAGLPADSSSLFQTSPATAQAIWQQAVTGGVIPAELAKDVPTATASFQALSAARSLDAPPPVGLSTMREMLATSLPQAAQQNQFAQLYVQYQDDWPRLWQAVERDFGTEAATQLQLTGQLCYLTINNQPLVTALTAAEAANGPLGSTMDLVSRGYYEPTKWTPLIGTSIPPEIPGADAAEQTANYAALLAAQVRLSYPTAVVADQVTRNIVPVVGTADVADGVAEFLTAHQADFRIGGQPVEQYIASAGLTDVPATVVSQIKRIQRVYQLTPDDTSMATLLRHNLDSAFAITRYDADGFVRAFGDQVGGTDRASMIHTRAAQIHSTTLGVAVAYLGGRLTPGLGGSRAPVQPGMPAQAAPPDFPVTAYPTLEGLFGSLDYCNCSDCGSLLSPAAYLVDLLNYIDQPAPASGSNPQDILFLRRPDLQYLPLTCANTNTALPYIDIVNEVLEYFVANGLNMSGYQGHDTGDTITAAELAACPQYVNNAAYGLLKTAFFPPPLPFNQPLTLLRLVLQGLGTTLPAAMMALRLNDNLVNDVTPTSYGWNDILNEQLTISRDEYRLFTDPSLGLGDLYGLPDSNALDTLQNSSMADFSRRLGVSYDDLVSIVSTQFINPNAALIPRLDALCASFTTLAELNATVGTSGSIAAQFIAALPAGLDAMEYGGNDPGDYQAVVAWVTNPANYQRIMSIITIANPAGTQDDCSGAALQLRYSNPDNTTNVLCGTDFLKLIRFIRLWGKLGPLLGDADDAVTIEQTDDIIAALYPAVDVPAEPVDPPDYTASDAANRPLLDAGFATLLRRTGFLFQVMNGLSLTADNSLDQLLACWAPIGTVGPDSLYQNMFLTPTLLQQDPGAQTATVGSTVNAGDVLVTTIDGIAVPSYTVQPGDTAITAAAAVATSINAVTTLDPPSGPALNARIYASSSGVDGVITIVAGYTLACSVLPGGSESYTAAAGTPVSGSATVGDPVTAGDTLRTAIDGVPVDYIVVPGDTTVSIAAGIAAAVNATTTADPYSGLPLNALVVASSEPGSAVVSFDVAGAGAPFTLTCALTPANAGSYTATPPVPTSSTATIAGAAATGDVLVTTINSVAVSYTATAADTDTTVLAANIAATINAATGVDPVTQVPLSGEVQATSAGAVVTVTAIDPATLVTLSCSAPAADQYVAVGPLPEAATATISGVIPAGTTLTTTVNTLPLFYLTTPSDTPGTIAGAIAAQIKACEAADPVSGLPMNALVEPVVTVTGATQAVIHLTALSPTTPFTLAVAMSASGYTAGQRTAPFADDGYGDFLTDQSQLLFGHEPTLCAACNLTGAEFALITGALGFGPTTKLTIDNVSALLRFGWLAHTLGLSVLEFLLLRQYSGLDPFASIDPGTPPPTEPPVIRFIRLLGALSTAGLSTAQALYLIWNADISGTSAPPLANVTGLAFALAADFAAVQVQFAPQQVDPTGSIALNLMTLVYGAAASTTFFGLLNGTYTTSTGYSTPAGVATLPQPVIDASGGRLSYDNLAKQLTFGGVLDAGTQAAIDAAVTASAPDAAVLTAAIIALAAANQQVVSPFFTTYPELLPLYTAYVASAAAPTDKRTALLASFLPILAAKRMQEQALAAVTAAAGTDPSFASTLLADPTILHADNDPTLAAITDLVAIQNQGLSAQFFLGNDPASPPDQSADYVAVLSYAQTITIGGTPATGDTVTITINGVAIAYQIVATDSTLATLAGSVAAAINAATATDPVSGLPVNQVVTATVLPAGQVAGDAVLTVAGLNPSGANGVFTLAATPDAATPGTGLACAVGSQLPAATGPDGLAATWNGFLTVPQDGLYDINITADPGAAITLQIDGTAVPGPAQVGPAGLWTNQGPISLTAGALVPITLAATSLKTTLSVSWQTQGLGWAPIGTQYLFPLTLVSRLGNTYVRFLKATSLASALSLTAAEIAYLGTALPITGQSWLSVLDPQGWLSTNAQQAPDPATATSLTAVLTALLDFSLMKQALSPADSRLLAVLANPSATLPVTVPVSGPVTVPVTATTLPATNSALLSLTGWDLTSVNALLTQFFGGTSPAPLSDVTNLRRVYDAYAVVKTCGLPASPLIAATTNAPSATTVGALESALRAQYAEPDWLTVIGPVNNTARMAQRDALVAYILQRLGDIYAATLVPGTTSQDAATGATTLTITVPAGAPAISAGMTVQGDLIAPGTTVAGVASLPGELELTLSAGLLAAAPAGSSLVLASADTLAIDTVDTLYEYFLIDTQNEPAVLTSRILLALSTVQLFIERVVRNLEPGVSAADVDSTLWTWMKRYRVWQANREVFLWPENWLYPELRDNQSPFFQQMMSTLLQGDITDDAATSAYLNYLTSLEEVAKLEPCGLYYQPSTADTDETSYVLARTAGAHRTYYFRELTSDAWTPWAQVQVECEDMPITPVVWNGRLFLFWLKVIKRAPPASIDLSTNPTVSSKVANDSEVATLGMSDLQSYANATSQAVGGAGSQSVVAEAVLHWTEYYNGQWQPAKTSEIARPTAVGNFDPSGDGALEAIRNMVRIVPAQYTGTNPVAVHTDVSVAVPDDALILAITVASQSYNAGGFVLHNTHSLPVRFEDMTLKSKQGFPVIFRDVLDLPSPSRTLTPAQPYTGGYGDGTFTITYRPSWNATPTYTNQLLGYHWMPRWVEPQPGLPDAWDAPFFYEDRLNIFYVTTGRAFVGIASYGGFGLLRASPGTGAEPAIQPVVLGHTVSMQSPETIAAVSAPAGDPVALARYIADGTNIAAALPLPATVSYQGQAISPIGSLAALDQPANDNTGGK